MEYRYRTGTEGEYQNESFEKSNEFDASERLGWVYRDEVSRKFALNGKKVERLNSSSSGHFAGWGKIVTWAHYQWQ